MTDSVDRCGCDPQLRVPFGVPSDDTSSADAPSGAVVRAIADATDTPPLELAPLYGSIDLEALDRLFSRRDVATADPPLSVSFPVDDVVVTVDGDGWISVWDAEAALEPPARELEATD